MNTKTFKGFWNTAKKSPFEIALIALLLIAVIYAAVPSPVLADEADNLAFIEGAIQLEIDAMQNQLRKNGTLPKNELRGTAYSFDNIPVSAYNSVPWQTDATPCIGAQGTDICELLEIGLNTCAANFLPLGTIIEVEGLGICEVRDRMNARYYYRVDWYMGMDIAAAKSWGVKYLEIGVYAS
jgi:3D (Asp-Asp-Asp) domain-containing protein